MPAALSDFDDQYVFEGTSVYRTSLERTSLYRSLEPFRRPFWLEDRRIRKCSSWEWPLRASRRSLPALTACVPPA